MREYIQTTARKYLENNIKINQKKMNPSLVPVVV